MTALPERAREVLAFWFLEIDPGLWFRGGAEFDRLVSERFSEVLEEARAGTLDHWADTPRGLLALVIVLDQFPRNIHRGSGAAFASDARAQDLVAAATARGDAKHLSASERQFLFMPLMHAEDPALQQEGLRRFADLAQDAASILDFARRHAAIVERFGRFPHRNAELGRSSTATEEEWLAENGNPFG